MTQRGKRRGWRRIGHRPRPLRRHPAEKGAVLRWGLDRLRGWRRSALFGAVGKVVEDAVRPGSVINETTRMSERQRGQSRGSTS